MTISGPHEGRLVPLGYGGEGEMRRLERRLKEICRRNDE